MKMPVNIHSDNNAAVSTVTNLGSTARNRHYERWVLYGREQFIHGLSFPRWIATDRQVADIFTKPLAQDLFYRFRSVLLNLCGRKHKRSGIFWMFSA